MCTYYICIKHTELSSPAVMQVHNKLITYLVCPRKWNIMVCIDNGMNPILNIFCKRIFTNYPNIQPQPLKRSISSLINSKRKIQPACIWVVKSTDNFCFIVWGIYFLRYTYKITCNIVFWINRDFTKP